MKRLKSYENFFIKETHALYNYTISKKVWDAIEKSSDPEVKKLLTDYKASYAKDSEEQDKDQGMFQQYMHFDPSSNKTLDILDQLLKLANEKGIDFEDFGNQDKPTHVTPVTKGFWDKVKSKF